MSLLTLVKKIKNLLVKLFVDNFIQNEPYYPDIEYPNEMGRIEKKELKEEEQKNLDQLKLITIEEWGIPKNCQPKICQNSKNFIKHLSFIII